MIFKIVTGWKWKLGLIRSNFQSQFRKVPGYGAAVGWTHRPGMSDYVRAMSDLWRKPTFKLWNKFSKETNTPFPCRPGAQVRASLPRLHVEPRTQVSGRASNVPQRNLTLHQSFHWVVNLWAWKLLSKNLLRIIEPRTMFVPHKPHSRQAEQNTDLYSEKFHLVNKWSSEWIWYHHFL